MRRQTDRRLFVSSNRARYKIVADNEYMMNADNNADIGTVMIHADIMFRNSFQSTPREFDVMYPTKTTEPTLQWVVEIGSPILLANSTVNADPISIVNPLQIRPSLVIHQKSLKSIHLRPRHNFG